MRGLTQISRRGSDAPPAPLAFAGPLDVGLVLTHACNLACSYCYTGEKKRVRMSDALGHRAIEQAIDLATTAGTALQLSFFGGEPLLERELLVELASTARARAQACGVALTLQVTTNGTLLDDAIVTALGELGVHVAISIDGTGAQHDALRPRSGGGPSHAACMRGLTALLAQRERWPFDVISVVDPRTVAGLAEGVIDLLDRGVEAITLNMNWGGPWDDRSLASFEQQIERVAAVFLAWLRRGRWCRIQPLESSLHMLADRGELLPAHCGAGSRRLAVAPSGRLYGCTRAVGEDTGEGAIGHLDDGLAPRVPPPRADVRACSCARREETGDVAVVGRVQLRHDEALARVARRVAAVIEAEFESIHIVERGPAP